MSDRWPRELGVFETSDSALFRNRSAAEHWQLCIDGAHRATGLLEGGSSVGAAMRAGGLLREGTYPELDEVFASTKLIIEHWQCRDQPGYQPREIRPNGDVYVGGDAGSWAGSYGSTCTPGEVVRYWLDTKMREERRKARGHG